MRKIVALFALALSALFALAVFLPSSQHNEPASTLGAARSPAEAGNDVDEAQLPVEASNEFGVAVIIGNKAYQDDRVAEVLYAHNDADAFHEFVVRSLGFSPDNVVDLRDATKVEMEGAFGAKGNAEGQLWRWAEADGSSDIVVFYSGHGVPGISDGRGYLLPVDANLDMAAVNGYPIDVLYENLAEVPSKSVTVYLDACFSGGSGDGGVLVRNASPVSMAADVSGVEGMTVLTAAGSEQLASWDIEAQHGLFTEHLLDALYGAADADADGGVSAAEARRYLDRHMTRAARRAHGREQDAMLHGDEHTVLSIAPSGGWVPRPRLGPPPAAFTVLAEPQGARVRVLNIGRYRAGMKLAAGTYEVQASAPGYVTKTERVSHGSSPTVQRIVLSRRGQPFTIVPELAARSTSTATPASEIRLLNHAEPYRAGMLLPPGSYRVEASAEGYETATENVSHGASPTVRRIALREAVPKAGELFRDCAECPEMVVVPAGSYGMGRKGQQRKVTIGAPFAVGKTEVSFAQWDACARGGGCPRDEGIAGDRGWGRGQRPVIYVSWDDAQLYVRWLWEKTKKPYRLLSESEWEYAARAGTETRYSWGDETGDGRANCSGCGSQRDNQKTAPVGSFAANAWGLHDMHGNVREWVKDCWNRSLAKVPLDGSALQGKCSSRVLRGGSWDTRSSKLRAAYRNKLAAGTRRNDVGFRVARTAGYATNATKTETVVHGSPAKVHEMVLSRSGQPFTVVTEPADAEVRLLDHAQAYQPGMLLPPGSYRVRASAEGYETATETVSHGSAPTSRQIQLRRVGPKARAPFRDCPECPEMVVVPTGSYGMGRKGRQRKVTIGEPFALGKYEVTFAQWDACARGGGCPRGRGIADDEGWGRGNRPVIHVNRYDAQRYVEWLSAKTGETYRLPSESEWEYAARAGTDTAYSWGDEIGRNKANCLGCGSRWSRWRLLGMGDSKTAPVGSFAPNAWGLHDMHGNVSEWVDNGVLRGGSWISGTRALRAAHRDRFSSDSRVYKFGFRVARMLTP